jgi:hypothetical protein
MAKEEDAVFALMNTGNTKVGWQNAVQVLKAYIRESVIDEIVARVLAALRDQKS